MARTSQRSNTERFKYGICLNDECPKCKGKEVQQIPMRKEFVCEECGNELRECPPPKKRNNKRYIIIGAAVVVIAGIVLVLLWGGKSVPLTITLNKTQMEMTEGCTDTIVATVLPDDAEYTLQFRSSDENVAMVSATGIVAAISEGEATITATVFPKNGDSVIQTINVLVISTAKIIDTTTMDTISIDTVIETISVPQLVDKPTETKAKPKQQLKIDLGFATYEALEGSSGIKYGQPHGNGIMRFKNRQTIPGTVDCIAEPGEWVSGMWRDGKINVGTWYRNDGNQVIVKLGQRYNK